MKQVSEKENQLLGKKSYVYEIEHAGSASPKKTELKEQLSKKLGAPIEKIVVRNILTTYGSNTSIVEVEVYEDEKVMKLLAPQKGKKPAAAKAK